MTGPEHYREAERLIQNLTTDTGAVYVEDGNEQVIALAQVHATLALVAAQAESWIDTTDDRTGSYVHAGWVEALS